MKLLSMQSRNVSKDEAKVNPDSIKYKTKKKTVIKAHCMRRRVLKEDTQVACLVPKRNLFHSKDPSSCFSSFPLGTESNSWSADVREWAGAWGGEEVDNVRRSKAA